ncbi:hypothetical protein IAT38_004978 [Cryptococcus sp. DSM 104549]
MSNNGRLPTPAQVNDSYRPNGYGMSPSLIRARQPFLFTNRLIGGTIIAFVIGVYTYSISAVKQDDFSDVEDLLPPLEERSKLRSIEDDIREGRIHPGTSHPGPSATGTPSAPSKGVPFPDDTIAQAAASVSSQGWGIKRLSDIDWIKKRGLVDGKGNVLVWGAPDVDRIGRMGDKPTGKKLV